MGDPGFSENLRAALHSGVSIYADALARIASVQPADEAATVEGLRQVGFTVGIPLTVYLRALHVSPALVGDTYLREILVLVLDPLATSATILGAVTSISHARQLPLAPMSEIEPYLHNDPLGPWLQTGALPPSE